MNDVSSEILKLKLAIDLHIFKAVPTSPEDETAIGNLRDVSDRLDALSHQIVEAHLRIAEADLAAATTELKAVNKRMAKVVKTIEGVKTAVEYAAKAIEIAAAVLTKV